MSIIGSGGQLDGGERTHGTMTALRHSGIDGGSGKLLWKPSGPALTVQGGFAKAPETAGK